jgi:predicted tellurium resistance membrane protein TerC
MLTPEQKKKNLTLGLILATVVLVFFLGFMVRLMYFGSPKKPQVIPSAPATAAPANKSQ